jgi:hypothetical protein
MVTGAQSSYACIGRDINHEAASAQLMACLLAPEEMAAGSQSWLALADPYARSWAEATGEEAGGRSGHEHAHAHEQEHEQEMAAQQEELTAEERIAVERLATELNLWETEQLVNAYVSPVKLVAIPCGAVDGPLRSQ